MASLLHSSHLQLVSCSNRSLQNTVCDTILRFQVKKRGSWDENVTVFMFKTDDFLFELKFSEESILGILRSRNSIGG